MKRWVAAWVMAAALAGGARADNGWGLFGSYWAPGDWDSTFGAGGRISFEVAENTLLDIRGTWFDDFVLTQGGSELLIESIPVDVGLTIVAGLAPVDIYLFGGLSWYSMEAEVLLADGARTNADLDDEIGFYGGIGIEVAITEDVADMGATRITLFAEGLYRHVSLDEVSVAGGEAIGSDMSGFALNAGIMIRW